MIGGGQKTKINPRSVDVMPLTEDKFEVREKFTWLFIKDGFLSLITQSGGLWEDHSAPICNIRPFSQFLTLLRELFEKYWKISSEMCEKLNFGHQEQFCTLNKELSSKIHISIIDVKMKLRIITKKMLTIKLKTFP